MTLGGKRKAGTWRSTPTTARKSWAGKRAAWAKHEALIRMALAEVERMERVGGIETDWW